ncbi:MAG: hypothetical protein PVJ15_05475 [Gammaproteobacteria bacterium]|jgi:TM2 domain-containing membrane protein YozV
MRRSTKAALLSGLVFPGMGHLYLRQYVRGVLLAGGAGALLYFIVSVAMSTAFDVMEKIQSGDVPLNAESVSELVSEESQDGEESTNIASMALIVLWVIGIADSYREGRAREQAGEMSSKGK